MNTRVRTVIIAVAGSALAGFLATAAVGQPPKPAASKTNWSATDLLPLTCAQAWAKSRKSYPGMVSIVETLARVSLANRDLTFPNTREAGLDVGKAVAADCESDPNSLLFAIVDKHVRRVSEGATGDKK
jgi:hypothetical protein